MLNLLLDCSVPSFIRLFPDFIWSTLQRKFNLCIPFLGITRPQSQFPHACVCERFIYSQLSVHIFFSKSRIGRSIVGSLRHMNVGIETVAAQFLFWEYLLRLFGIVSLQCMQCFTYSARDNTVDVIKWFIKVLEYFTFLHKEIFLFFYTRRNLVSKTFLIKLLYSQFCFRDSPFYHFWLK